MKDLRTILPSESKVKLYREICKRLSKKYQKERDYGREVKGDLLAMLQTEVKGDLLAMLQTEVKRELEIDYPYLQDMNGFEAMCREACWEAHRWL